MSFKKDKMPTPQQLPPVAKLFVATPMYGGMCIGNYAAALMQLPMVLSAAGIKMYYTYMMNESLITRARNRCAHEFLNIPEASHLLFIDSDIGFDPTIIPSMLNKDVDILCGLYPKKEINWPRVTSAVQRGVQPNELAKYSGAVVVNLIKQETTYVNDGDLLEINNGGTGFMLIKREVFETLRDKVPAYLNDMYHATVENPEPQYIKEYFATSIDEESGRLLSEDYHFCVLARKHGFKIYADPAIELSHTGTYTFTGAVERI